MACTPAKYGRVVVKNFGKKSVGEGQKILILEEMLCYGGGSIFSGGRQTIFWEDEKLNNHSIKRNYSNMF